MATKTKSGFVEVTESFSGDYEGEAVTLNTGEVFATDHPFVKRFGQFFKPLERERPAVEQTTAAPGEKRGER